MANNELLVKVKLVSDNMNPSPSPVLGMGGSSMVVSGSPGSSSGANTTGGANPLAQNALKAADGLSQLNQHAAKASEALAQVRESSKGMLSALKAALFTGGGNSQASPGHLQALMGGAKQFLGQYGMPMAVGGTALAGAGLIMGGVNAADNFMVSRGAKPWLGHGSWDRNASGELYGWSPTRLMNEAEVSLIGGGRINNRGDIRTWDQIKGTEDNKFAEAMRRTSMQSPVQAIEAATRRQQSDLRLQFLSNRNQYAGYKDYAVDAELARDRFMSGMGPLLDSSKASTQKLYGNDIGAMIAAQERMAAGQHGVGYGQQVAEARAARQTNTMNMFNTERELEAEERNLKGIRADIASGGNKGMAMKSEEESLEQIAKLKRKIADIGQQDIQINERLKVLVQEQAKSQREMVTQQLGGVMQSRLSEAQTLQGQKEAFGMMDVGDQQYLKDVASRFQQGGIEAITAEERGMLLNSPLGEDVRIQARKRGDDAGFADIYRGSRAEARATELEGRQGQLEKLQVELNKTVTVNAQSDKTELAKEIVTVLGKYFSEISLAVEAQASIQKKAADNQARLTGQQKSGANQ